MPDSYLALKTIHLLGAILFYGNVIVTSWWKASAARTRDARVIAFALKQVWVTDILFTATGSIIILATGVGNAHLHNQLPWETPWMMWGLVLFMLSGILWGAVMIPLQLRQSRMAREFLDSGEIPEKFWQLERWWQITGGIAKLLPLAIVVIMVFKPL